MRCTFVIGVQQGCLSLLLHKRLGVAVSHALYTCACLDALFMQRCRMQKWISFDAKRTNCLFLGYFKETKAYCLMCVATRKIIRYRDVVFGKDNINVGHGLEMSLSGSCETPSLVLINESSKSTSSMQVMMMIPRRRSL